MLKNRFVLGVAVAVLAAASLSAAAFSAAAGAQTDELADCSVWEPYVLRDLQEARADNSGEFPTTWEFELPDAEGTLIDVPYLYEWIDADSARIQADPTLCEPGLPGTWVDIDGVTLDALDFSDLDEGPDLQPAATTTTTTTTTTTALPGTTPTPAATPSCDPNYEGACVPVSAADLDCPDINGTNFRVVGIDIHGLDGNDNDGLACEQTTGRAATTPASTTSPRPLALTG